MCYIIPEGSTVRPAKCEIYCPKIDAGLDESGHEGAVCSVDDSVISSADMACAHGYSFVENAEGKRRIRRGRSATYKIQIRTPFCRLSKKHAPGNQ